MAKDDKQVIDQTIVVSDIGDMLGDQEIIDATGENTTSLYDKPIQISNVETLHKNVTDIIMGIQASEGDNATYYAAIQEDRESLKDNPDIPDMPWPGASEIVFPVCQQQLFVIYTQIVSAIFDVNPIARSMREGHLDNEGYCVAVDKFVHALLIHKTNWITAVKRAIYMALRDRSSVIYTTWKTTKKRVTKWEPVYSQAINRQTGQVGHKLTNLRAVSAIDDVYDFPTYQVLPIDQFGTFPAANGDIQESPGVWSKFTMDASELLAGCEGDNPLYDRKAVDNVINSRISGSIQGTPDDKNHHIGNSNPDTEKVRQLIDTMYEVYWRFPSEVDGEPVEDWLFTIDLHTHECVRAIPNPWWHGKRPFTLIRPYPTVFGLFGDSVISAGARHTQNTKSTLIRHADNHARKTLQPPIATSQNMWKQVIDMFSRNRISHETLDKPGGILPFPNAFFDSGGKGIMPFTPGAAPTSVLPLLDYLDKEMGRYGVTDNMQGVSSGNITATQSAQMNAGGHNLLGLLIDNTSTQVSEQMSLSFELCRQFVESKLLRKLWQNTCGTLVNGVTNAPISIEDVIMEDFYIVANGLTESSNRQQRAQQMTQLITALTNEPNVMQDPKRRYTLLHDYVQGIGISEPEKYLGSPDEWIAKDQAKQDAAKQASQVMQQDAALPGGGGGQQPPSLASAPMQGQGMEGGMPNG